VAAAISPLSVVGKTERGVDPTQRPSAANASAFARALGSADGSAGVGLVAPVRTRLDPGQASAALRSAWQSVMGEEPSEGTVKVLTAQWAHETGNGASMFNYNFGGIKGAGPSGLSVAQRTREGFGANERTIVDNFRAYRTADEGAGDYVRLLKARFPGAVEAAKNADPQAFVHALKARGYFTGDEGAYTRSIVALSGMEMPQGIPDAPPTLDLRRTTAQASASGFEPGFAGADPSSVLVDGLALADEISRAALRIAAATRPNGSKGEEG
jgi:hypothetical protein